MVSTRAPSSQVSAVIDETDNAPRRTKARRKASGRRQPSAAAAAPQGVTKKASSKRKAASGRSSRRAAGAQAIALVPARIRDIVTGLALPTNAQEAEEAATVRRECLVRMHLKGKGTTRRAAMAEAAGLAFPPEFAPTNGKQADAVHCVCGKEQEGWEGEWIACDDCNVWQHLPCMGEGVPADPDEEEYQCQQCDPFRHRELVRALRRRDRLPDDVLPGSLE